MFVLPLAAKMIVTLLVYRPMWLPLTRPRHPPRRMFMPVGNNYYTVFYTDDKSTVTTHDEHTAPPSGKARVRFINLSSAVASNVDFGLTTGNKIVSGLAYKAASAYYNVDAATTFSLYASGSTTAMLSIPATIQAGHIYTIYISGATQATVTYHVLVQD
jgi:hypothetical protein